MIELRGYQDELIHDTISAIQAKHIPVSTAPPGSGKSLMGAAVMLELCKMRAMSGLSLSHIERVIRQNRSAAGAIMNGHDNPAWSLSTYSAGIGEKDLSGDLVFAGIQSFANLDLSCVAQPDLISIDECHRVPVKESSQYGRVLSHWNDVPRCGWSATPYRLDSGLLHEGDDAWFDVLINSVTVARLQNEGYLAPLRGVISKDEMDVRGVHHRGGEFITSELEEIATDPKCLERIAKAILYHAAGRKKILIFCVSTDHSDMLAEKLTELGCFTYSIHSKLADEEKQRRFEAFEKGFVRAATNVQVLSTGTDIPAIDCIVFVRATESKSLRDQMIGRGLRISPEKEDTLVLDFAGNMRRLGDIDGIPEHQIVDEPRENADKKKKTSTRKDPKKYKFQLDEGAIESETPVEVAVKHMVFRIEQNAKNAALHQIRVLYKTSEIGWVVIWLLPEHDRRGRWHTERWFARRGVMHVPYEAEKARAVAMSLPKPESISVRREGSFWRIICEHFPQPATGEVYF